MLEKSATLAPTLALPGAALVAVPASAPSSARGDGAAAADFSAVLAGLTLTTDLTEAPEGATPPPADLGALQAAHAGKTGIVGNRHGKILPPGKQPAEPGLAEDNHADADAELASEAHEHTASTEPATLAVVQHASAPEQQRTAAPAAEQPGAGTIIPRRPESPTHAGSSSVLAAPKPQRQRPSSRTETALVAAAPLPRTQASRVMAPAQAEPLAPASTAPAPSSAQIVATAALLQPGQPAFFHVAAQVTAGAAPVRPGPRDLSAADATISVASTTSAGLPVSIVPPRAQLAQQAPVTAGAPDDAAVQVLSAISTDGIAVAPRSETALAQAVAPAAILASSAAAPGRKAGTPQTPNSVTSAEGLPGSARVEVAAPSASPHALVTEGPSKAALPDVAAPAGSGMREASLEPQPALALALALAPGGPVEMRAAPLAAPALNADRGQDIAALVDRIVEARAAAAPDTVRAALVHEEFGSISLRLRTQDSHIQVTLGSADPGFAPAVHAAAAASLAGQSQNEADRREPSPAQHQPHQPGHDASAQNAPSSQQQQASRNPASAGERAPSPDNHSGRSASEQAQQSQTAPAPDRRAGIYA